MPLDALKLSVKFPLAFDVKYKTLCVVTSKLIVPDAAVAVTTVGSAAFVRIAASFDVLPANVTVVPSDVAPSISPTVAALS